VRFEFFEILAFWDWTLALDSLPEMLLSGVEQTQKEHRFCLEQLLDHLFPVAPIFG
jgi:hypothetical protein